MEIEYTNSAGVISTWTYNKSKNPYGPISVELTYPDNYKCDAELEDKLPITKQTFWNPDTESFVGYGRAKQLGLI
jgi:hypothetical protein